MVHVAQRQPKHRHSDLALPRPCNSPVPVPFEFLDTPCAMVHQGPTKRLHTSGWSSHTCDSGGFCSRHGRKIFDGKLEVPGGVDPHSPSIHSSHREMSVRS